MNRPKTNDPKDLKYWEPSHTVSGDVNEDITKNMWILLNYNTTGICYNSPMLECIPKVSEVRAPTRCYFTKVMMCYQPKHPPMDE